VQQVLTLIDQARAILLDIGVGCVDDETVFGCQDLELEV
jgi:hypothetical protein